MKMREIIDAVPAMVLAEASEKPLAKRTHILFHGGPCDLPNNRPVGKAAFHFADRYFFSGLRGWFGPCTYEYDIPTEVAQRILKISFANPPVDFLNAALQKAISVQLWGPGWPPELPEVWDEDSMDEYFNELVTNSAHSGIADVIRDFDLYGIEYFGEYLLLQSGIDRLNFRRKIRARGRKT